MHDRIRESNGAGEGTSYRKTLKAEKPFTNLKIYGIIVILKAAQSVHNKLGGDLYEGSLRTPRFLDILSPRRAYIRLRRHHSIRSVRRSIVRLDKLIANAGLAARSEVARNVRGGRVLVNGAPAKSPALAVDPDKDTVVYCGREVRYREHIYIMLNKPEGYVSATEDKSSPVVTDLLSPADAARVHPCGRLDKYTVGLMLLTDDGIMSHRLLAPARHVPKTYSYVCESALSLSDKKRLSEGVHIEGGYLTKPCLIAAETEHEGRITITEGKYHQIKQMFGAVGNRIAYLERISFGALTLDPSLARGEWRYLTDEEISALETAAKQ